MAGFPSIGRGGKIFSLHNDSSDEYEQVLAPYIAQGIVKPGGLVIENYTRCQLGGNKHARLIVNPSKTESMSVHEAKFSNGQCAV